MFLRENELPNGSGPFNLNAAGFCGGTISGTKEEMHLLGQLLIEALATRSEVTKENWCLEIADSSRLESWTDYTENEVSIVFDQRFEWRLDWSEAFSLAEDYADTHFNEASDNASQETSRLWEEVKQANSLVRDEAKIECLLDRCAWIFASHLGDSDQYRSDANIGMLLDGESDQLHRCDCEITAQVIQAIGQVNGDWFRYFEDTVRQMTVGETNERSKRLSQATHKAGWAVVPG